MNGIEVKNISKDFGNVYALKNVSVHFEENIIYGLLGRNGIPILDTLFFHGMIFEGLLNSTSFAFGFRNGGNPYFGMGPF